MCYQNVREEILTDSNTFETAWVVLGQVKFGYV